MANHKSAEKRARQNKKRAVRNMSWKTQVKSTVKRFRKLMTQPQAVETLEITQALQNAQRILQRVVSKKVMHKRTASRRISRLMRAFNSHQASAQASSNA